MRVQGGQAHRALVASDRGRGPRSGKIAASR